MKLHYIPVKKGVMSLIYFSTSSTAFSTLLNYFTSGFDSVFNSIVENCIKLINHSTILTAVSTVFTVEIVENRWTFVEKYGSCLQLP